MIFQPISAHFQVGIIHDVIGGVHALGTMPSAAKKFFRKLLQGLTSVPRGIITDQLKSDSAATREVLPSVEHRQHRYLTNGSENSPQPTRQRERWCTSRGGT
jgi:transposase-like protein